MITDEFHLGKDIFNTKVFVLFWERLSDVTLIMYCFEGMKFSTYVIHILSHCK